VSKDDGDRNWERVAGMAELGMLTASLVHELRQPLFAVKGVLQLAHHRATPLGPEELTQVLQHVRYIEDLLDHYAGFGRIDETAVEFDLNQPVRRALAMLEHRRRQTGVRIEPQLSAEQLWVLGRPTALRQVAVNLMQNALDAMASHPERVLEVTTASIGDEVELWVRDTGPGVPEGLRDRLFEPFMTTKPPGRGTGLGLFIARKLVEEAGGKLYVEFPPGGGTHVCLRLPLSEERSWGK
jgi:C4-dicarboxylate-specific signal transduction histidine kinase